MPDITEISREYAAKQMTATRYYHDHLVDFAAGYRAALKFVLDTFAEQIPTDVIKEIKILRGDIAPDGEKWEPAF